MFVNLTKNQILKALESEYLTQKDSENRKERCKGRLNEMVYNMVKNARLEKFKNIAYNKNGGLNKGYVVENLVLDYKDLEAESKYCEIKFFGNDTPNVLVNENTRLIYIVVAKATCKGAYIIRNMRAVRNQRLTLEYLTSNDLINENNRCVKLEEYLGL